MTSVRRRRPAARHDTQTVDPATESRRLPAALIGEVPRLRRYATAWLGNPAAADDAVQDAIQRVIAQGDAPDQPQRLRIRLLRLLHGLRENAAGRPHNDGFVGLRSLSRELRSSGVRGEGLRMQELIGAIERLADEQRQALLLITLEGLSYREAADVLERPLGTVMARLASARQELSTLTGERDADGPSGSNGSATRSGVSELDLHAYLDGELSAGRIETVEAFLRSHPAQAERLERFAERNEMIRKLYDPLLNRPVPPELLVPLLAITPHPAEPRRWPALATIAAAAGLLLLGFVAGWLLHSHFTPGGIVIPWLAR